MNDLDLPHATFLHNIPSEYCFPLEEWEHNNGPFFEEEYSREYPSDRIQDPSFTLHSIPLPSSLQFSQLCS